MVSTEREFGIFICNELLKDFSKHPESRTVLLGQIIIIDQKVSDKTLAIRFLKENDTWETTAYSCPEDKIVRISEKLYPYIASITSPQERVKLAKNRELCNKLQRIGKDMVVGFIDTNDILLGTVRFNGVVKGIGHCFGIELHERRKDNICSGSCAGIQYFKTEPGYAVFTTIEKIIPKNMSSTAITNGTSLNSKQSDIDFLFEKNLCMLNGYNDDRPKYEEIVTKYGEYPTKKFSTNRSTNTNYLRSSVSLQNMLDINNGTINPNNDFDQNTVLQPDKTALMKKPKNNTEMDLIDVIGGKWAGSTDKKQLDDFTGSMRKLDKNDNIKDKYYHLENPTNTLSRRNKSVNPFHHILDGNSTLKKSTAKFYTNNISDSKEEHKTSAVKTKKINEKNENPKSSSTFYVNEKPKFEDPIHGTTNDLVIGSLVEVLNGVSDEPIYGVVRWMGVENGTNFVLVGVELEEEQTHLPLTLSDGVYKGDRYFKCAENRAIFVSLSQCRKDSRFQDGVPQKEHEASAVEHNMDCPVIPGAVAPLCMPTEEDVHAVCGKYRGIQGHHNSCYLDVTLFAMFTYTSVFDSILFRPKDSCDIDDYEEVQRVLREEIVNPLRKNLFVSADHVMKLRRLLDRLSNISGLTSEEKDPEEFLNSLLAQILKAEPFLKLNSGQETFHYQLFVEKDAHLTLPTVQHLFEQSFLTSNIKLKEVPSCLIIQMPRFGKNYKMYPRILPSQLLDVTDVIDGSPRNCIVCGELARYECRECFDDCSNAGLESTAFCMECLKKAHQHEKRKHHKHTKLSVPSDFSSVYEVPRLFMELFAVICIETSHYVAFVKCGVGHEAPWCFFDSMADRLGEKHGFNIPEMVACPDVPRWLSDETLCKNLHEECPNDRHLPEHARRLLCDAYICMYQSSDVMMYR
ncbi:ubiquitin carboxyl-terminal hydrolase CYLD isoform X1 [Diorhabda carinulata]|uniref:ubiquitin carboxyl-terminal hydrolase CYLD isoform X1 n=2 Tax=Diorhabda carinulata TaxID=1163345 RepID=UPI0025A1564D|nr:ubiquitin carboxyl-terminal hydrolase CYLD isoform X1 [Diorhabda carinulata]XP_057672895.1 ubiquitin carboxyl-terminal hydrolase CYLD isoform X1 [Diorhabda carinulata]XP_057672896.1 ubiquitin carboxyl-terminal hydrolase CYLD isoform X1 [Diorhabda carinulata]